MIKKDNKTIKLKIVRTNNKHTYIRPENGYLEVKLGKNSNLNIIKEKILERFDKYYNLTREISVNEMYLWGKLMTLRIADGLGFEYSIDGSFINVFAKKEIDIKKTILLLETKKYLKENLEEINFNVRKNGYKVVPIILKELKSKFGSYHLKKHEIILNIHLAAYDKECIKYILYHEYTHQKYPHHQKSFYKALSSLYPNYKEIEKLLKEKRIY